MTKVSALVSAYYAEDFITRRLVNLFNQSLKPEVVVVCKEGSPEHEVADMFDVVLVTTSDIPTIGKAWNMAIEASSGEYLTTANTDDLFHQDGLERMANVLDTTDADLVFSMVHIQDKQEIPVPWIRYQHKTGMIENAYKLLSERCIVGAMPMWRKIAQKACGAFREDFTVACDYDMWLKMARAGKRFYYLAESVGVYTYRMGSLEHRNSKRLMEENIEIRKSL